jgi:hypothetical protein
MTVIRRLVTAVAVLTGPALFVVLETAGTRIA